jgi:hypothetical protein
MTETDLTRYATIDEHPFHFGEWAKTPVETENNDSGRFLTLLNMIRHNCTSKFEVLLVCPQGPLPGPSTLYTHLFKKTPKEDYLFIFSDKAILKEYCTNLRINTPW